jgi:hypothetical protein
VKQFTCFQNDASIIGNSSFDQSGHYSYLLSIEFLALTSKIEDRNSVYSEANKLEFRARVEYELARRSKYKIFQRPNFAFELNVEQAWRSN